MARAIREFVRAGGFVFAMCSATDSYADIALAAEGIDIAPREYDHDGTTPNCRKLLISARRSRSIISDLKLDPLVYEYSDIDIMGAAAARGEQRHYFQRLRQLSGEIRSRADDAAPNHVSASRGSWGRRRRSRRA